METTHVPTAVHSRSNVRPSAKDKPIRRVSRQQITILLLNAVGIAIMLLLWHVLARSTHAAIVASPRATLIALSDLAVEGALWRDLQITLGRLLRALGLGTAIGFSLGLLAGIHPIRTMLEPARWVAMTVPAIIVVVLGMLWFGMGSQQVIFLVTFIVTPIIYVNTLAGIDSLDPQLIEMGRIYRFSRWQLFTEILLPGISASLIAGLTLATGIGVRAVILAELLGAFEGMGHSFNRAWTFLKTPELFAWMLASLLLMGVVEFGLLYPVRRYFTRWYRHAN